MNRTRVYLAAGAAVLLALAASVGSYKYLSGKSELAAQSRLQTTGIVVASLDIPIGTSINPNQVAISSWPKENCPKDALVDLNSSSGRVALRDFTRGEPIIESKLVPQKMPSGLLSLKIPPGMRAFSVKVNEVVGVGGFIVPDSRVDVVVTTPSPGHTSKNDMISKIVLEDVRVLAAGQKPEQKDNKPHTVNTVTLALTPADAEKLALASNDGIIQLIMRNFADNAVVSTGGVDKGRLLASFRNVAGPGGKEAGKKARKSGGKEPAKVASSAPPRAFVVEIIRGSKRTEETID